MEVYTARSGPEALRQMTQVWPDLVLMDHMMPDMDGVETTQHIREMGKKDPYFAVVPIIALTANAMKGVREEFLRSGFNDFLPKPIELDKLDNTLRAWVPEDKQKGSRHSLGTLPGRSCRRDLQNLPGIDVVRGMSYCGTGTPTARPSSSSGSRSPATSAASGRTGEEEKWEDYSIEVHSLKSAARWIGAMDLGDDAETLEMAGRGGDLEKVNARTEDLLEQCQKLGDTLAFL
ncbi:MAG: response regulator [Evtepia sp.]